MAKPVINSFSQIAPLIIQEYERYLPSAFDESLSILEKMNKIMAKLNEIGLVSNDVITQWNSVMEWVMNDGLTEDVNRKLDEMVADGTMDTIINQNIFNDLNTRIGNVETDVDLDKKNSVNGLSIVSLSYFPRLAGETDDNGRLTRALTEVSAGGVLHLGDDPVLEISATINITKKVHIIGNDTELKTITAGMDDTINVNGVTGFSLKGVRFNQDLKGRTSITLIGCSKFTIENCYFTGYSKEFAYYQTDGGIRMENCVDGRVINNEWVNHGQQYDTTTADLNRCLQMGGTSSDNIFVSGNVFDNVNQAIVIGSGNHMIIGNTFKNVRDNIVYMVDDHKSTLFSNNDVDHRYDESLVIGGGRLVVSSNSIKNVPNKAISVASGGTYPIDIIVTDNTFDNSDITSGQFIAWRDMSYAVRNLIVKNNLFKQPTNSYPYTYFDIGNVDVFKFVDNVVDVVTQGYQRLLYLEGTLKARGQIRNNRLIGTDATAKAIEVLSTLTDVDVLYQDNEVTNCRAMTYGLTVVGQSMQSNVAYAHNRTKLTTASSSAMPTSGNYKVGDYIRNEAPSIVGTAGSRYVVKGWTRITTGSAHVLNTDWVEDRALTGS